MPNDTGGQAGLRSDGPRLRGVARLWLLAALRRPGRAAAIVATIAVMSAATIGALVAADTLEQLFLADAAAEWAGVDVEVRAADDAVMEERTGRLLVIESGATTRAGAPRLLLQGVADHDAAPDGAIGVGVLGLGAEEQDLPPLEVLDGIGVPPLLDPEGAIVNERLAARLDLRTGEQLRLTVAVPAWLEDIPNRSEPQVHGAQAVALVLRVQGVVADQGTADLHRTPNVIVRRDALQQATGLGGRVTVTHLVATDPGRAGADAVIDRLAPLVRLTDLDADPVLADGLDLAEEEGGLFRSILLALAVLVVAAAAVATIGLLVALAEQRTGEIGVMRAIGVRRRAMGWLLTIEAATLGLAGAAIGVLAGRPFGALLAGTLAGHLADLGSGRGREQVVLTPVVDPLVVVLGCAVVVVVATAAGRSAARTVLAAEVADVLRGRAGHRTLPAGPGRRRILLGAGAYLLGVGTLAGGAVLFLGATVLLAAAWVHRRARLDDPAQLDRRAAAVGLVWSFAGAALLGDLGAGVQAGFGVLIAAGTTAIACVTVLLVPRLRRIMGWVRVLAPLGRAQAALRTSAAHAEQSRRRTGTVAATLGIALFMVAALSVLGSAQGISLDRQSGGFAVLGTSVGDLDLNDLGTLPQVGALAAAPESMLPQAAFSVEGPRGSRIVPYPIRLVGTTGGLAEAQAFGVAAALPEYPTAGEALRAVLADRDKVVLDRAALPEGAAVGDDVVIDIGPAPRRFRLIAVLDTFLLRSAFVNAAEFGELVPNRGETLLLARAAPEVTAQALADALEARGRPQGLLVDPVAQVRDDVIAVNRTFTDTFAVILGLAVLVALASVAAYVVLAARERRQQLAVLRVLGLRHRSLVLVAAAEPLLSGTVGAVAGLAVGLLHLRVLFAVGFSDLSFVLEGGRIAAVATGTVVLLGLACTVAAAVTIPRGLATRTRDLG